MREDPADKTLRCADPSWQVVADADGVAFACNTKDPLANIDVAAAVNVNPRLVPMLC